MSRLLSGWILAWTLLASNSIANRCPGADLDVGPGHPLASIEDALARAQPGDTILVHPRPGNAPYERVVLRVRTPRITLRGVNPAGTPRIILSGSGFDYSGKGAIPRAIVQFDPESEGSTLENFHLTGAHNASHNGAGVRINQANHITIRDCEIQGNDMGIMSAGDGTPRTGIGQLIERCSLHHNGDRDDPGYNHNLYLGGTSVLIRFCEIHHSLTGHNVKSRAHLTWVEYCHIHDAANREIDLVDGADTASSGSDAVVLGNLIRKNPETTGNRTVIHFGQDGGNAHNGTLYLAHNTIVTPFISPVVQLSTPQAAAQLVGNIVWDGGIRQRGQVVGAATHDADPTRISGVGNLFGPGFTESAQTSLDPAANGFDSPLKATTFVAPDRNDYRPTEALPVPVSAIPPVRLPAFPGHFVKPFSMQYREAADGEPRADEAQPGPGAFSPRDPAAGSREPE